MIGAMILGMLAASRTPSASGMSAANAVLVGGQAAAIQSQLNFSRDMEREADRIGLTLGSLRPGGATSLFEAGADLSEIQHRGRWDCLRTLGHYIQSANATLALARLTPPSVALTRRLGASFEVLVRGVGSAPQ